MFVRHLQNEQTPYSIKTCIALNQSLAIGALAYRKLLAAGVSPSGKAPAFDAGMRRFESCHPSHFYPIQLVSMFVNGCKSM